MSAHRRQREIFGLSILFASIGTTAWANPPARTHKTPPQTVRIRQAPHKQVTGTAIISPADANAQELLRRMLLAENSLTLAGDQVTIVSHGGLDVSSEQHVIRNGAHAARFEYLRPPRLAGEQIVDNGRFYWHYIPATKTLEVTPSQILRLQVRVGQVLQQMKRGTLRVQWIGQETVAGHDCGIIQVSPNGGYAAPSRRFWIDLTNGAQLKIEQYDKSGQLVSSSYYSDITYDPPLDRHAFDAPQTARDVHIVSPQLPHPLASVEQAQQQTSFPILQPTYLPAGFRFQSAAVSEFRKQTIIALRYVNGLNVISIYETPAPNNNGTGRAGRPQNGILAGVRFGLKVILVGNLAADEMEKVFNSVSPK